MLDVRAQRQRRRLDARTEEHRRPRRALDRRVEPASTCRLAGAESEAAELLDRASALSRSKGSGIMLERVAEVNAPRASTSAQPLSDSVI